MPRPRIFQQVLDRANKGELSKILANISWLVADQLLRMGVGLVIGVWIARYLGTEQFGILNYATAFVALFSPLCNLGLDGLTIKRLVENTSDRSQVLGTSFWMRFFAGWLTWAAIILGILFLRHNDLNTILIVTILGFSSIFQSFNTIDLWFQSQIQSKYSVLAKNISFVIISVFKIYAVTSQAPLVVFAILAILEAGISAIALIVLFNKVNPSHLLSLWSWSRSLAKDLLLESWPLIFSGLSVIVYLRIDQIMLGQMIGDKEVGIYSAATRISEVWYFIPTTIASSVAPAIYKAKQISELSYYSKIRQLNILLVLGSIVIALPMTFLSRTIIELLFGNNYTPAGEILSIHIWASVFVATGVATSHWFIAEGLNHLSMYKTLLGAISNIILNLFLIPIYAGKGAAIATVISYALSGLILHAIHPQTFNLFKMQIDLFQLFSKKGKF
jgi:polysaccharide transporter, PST family